MSTYAWPMMIPTPEEKERILLGLETIQICQDGYYMKNGHRISLSKEGSNEYQQVFAYSPEDLEHLR